MEIAAGGMGAPGGAVTHVGDVRPLGEAREPTGPPPMHVRDSVLGVANQRLGGAFLSDVGGNVVVGLERSVAEVPNEELGDTFLREFGGGVVANADASVPDVPNEQLGDTFLSDVGGAVIAVPEAEEGELGSVATAAEGRSAERAPDAPPNPPARSSALRCSGSVCWVPDWAEVEDAGRENELARIAPEKAAKRRRGKAGRTKARALDGAAAADPGAQQTGGNGAARQIFGEHAEREVGRGRRRSSSPFCVGGRGDDSADARRSRSAPRPRTGGKEKGRGRRGRSAGGGCRRGPRGDEGDRGEVPRVLTRPARPAAPAPEVLAAGRCRRAALPPPSAALPSSPVEIARELALCDAAFPEQCPITVSRLSRACRAGRAALSSPGGPGIEDARLLVQAATAASRRLCARALSLVEAGEANVHCNRALRAGLRVLEAAAAFVDARGGRVAVSRDDPGEVEGEGGVVISAVQAREEHPTPTAALFASARCAEGGGVVTALSHLAHVAGAASVCDQATRQRAAALLAFAGGAGSLPRTATTPARSPTGTPGRTPARTPARRVRSPSSFPPSPAEARTLPASPSPSPGGPLPSETPARPRRASMHSSPVVDASRGPSRGPEASGARRRLEGAIEAVAASLQSLAAAVSRDGPPHPIPAASPAQPAAAPAAGAVTVDAEARPAVPRVYLGTGEARPGEPPQGAGDGRASMWAREEAGRRRKSAEERGVLKARLMEDLTRGGSESGPPRPLRALDGAALDPAASEDTGAPPRDPSLGVSSVNGSAVGSVATAAVPDPRASGRFGDVSAIRGSGALGWEGHRGRVRYPGDRLTAVPEGTPQGDALPMELSDDTPDTPARPSLSRSASGVGAMEDAGALSYSGLPEALRVSAGVPTRAPPRPGPGAAARASREDSFAWLGTQGAGPGPADGAAAVPPPLRTREGAEASLRRFLRKFLGLPGAQASRSKRGSQGHGAKRKVLRGWEAFKGDVDEDVAAGLELLRCRVLDADGRPNVPEIARVVMDDPTGVSRDMRCACAPVYLIAIVRKKEE